MVVTPEKPYWSAGPCPWSEERGHDDYRHWCNRRPLCEPKKCERKAWAAKERAAEMRRYREFPGNPFQVETEAKAKAAKERGVKDWWAAALPKGHCRWCGGAIENEKKPGTLNLRRTWHPACLHRYYLHTRAETQLPFLVQRDGIGCKACGKPVGKWWTPRHWQTGEVRIISDGPENGWHDWIGPKEGPACAMSWSSGLQVDHVLALALVVLQIPERIRFRWWGPTNLQGLCAPCHNAKTKADVAAIKEARRMLGAAPPP